MFSDPTEIKDVPCSICGNIVAEDELNDSDWDWGLCSYCYEEEEE